MSPRDNKTIYLLNILWILSIFCKNIFISFFIFFRILYTEGKIENIMEYWIPGGKWPS